MTELRADFAGKGCLVRSFLEEGSLLPSPRAQSAWRGPRRAKLALEVGGGGCFGKSRCQHESESLRKHPPPPTPPRRFAGGGGKRALKTGVNSTPPASAKIPPASCRRRSARSTARSGRRGLLPATQADARAATSRARRTSGGSGPAAIRPAREVQSSGCGAAQPRAKPPARFRRGGGGAIGARVKANLPRKCLLLPSSRAAQAAWWGGVGGGGASAASVPISERECAEPPPPPTLPAASRREGRSAHSSSSELAEAAPHPDPLPARAGRGSRPHYSDTAFSEICQSLPSKIEMCSVFIGE